MDYLINVKKYSKPHIRQECFKRGIAGSIVSEVLEEAAMDSVEMILSLLKGKYAAKLMAENGKEKVYQALLRKGFSYSDINSAFYRLEDEEI